MRVGINQVGSTLRVKVYLTRRATDPQSWHSTGFADQRSAVLQALRVGTNAASVTLPTHTEIVLTFDTSRMATAAAGKARTIVANHLPA